MLKLIQPVAFLQILHSSSEIGKPIANKLDEETGLTIHFSLIKMCFLANQQELSLSLAIARMLDYTLLLGSQNENSSASRPIRAAQLSPAMLQYL